MWAAYELWFAGKSYPSLQLESVCCFRASEIWIGFAEVGKCSGKVEWARIRSYVNVYGDFLVIYDLCGIIMSFCRENVNIKGYFYNAYRMGWWLRKSSLLVLWIIGSKISKTTHSKSNHSCKASPFDIEFQGWTSALYTGYSFLVFSTVFIFKLGGLEINCSRSFFKGGNEMNQYKVKQPIVVRISSLPLCQCQKISNFFSYEDKCE